MRRLLVVFVVSLVVVVVPSAGARGGGCHPDEHIKPTDAAGTTVDISKCRMNPTILRVDSGTTVSFVNNDELQLAHNVHGLDWGIEQLDAGGSYQHTFGAEGIYPYACTLHPKMVGAVVVGGRATDAVANNSGSSGGASRIVVASVVGVVGVVGAIAATAIGRRRTAPVSP